MAVKTITLDLEAYELLSRHRKPGMSFSKVIKLHLGPRSTGHDLLVSAADSPPSEETLDAVEKLVRARRSSPARAPRL